MMHGIMRGKMNGWIDARIPDALRSSPEIVDGATALVDKIRVLGARRTMVFWASPVGRRRQLLRMHAEVAALSPGQLEKKAPLR